MNRVIILFLSLLFSASLLAQSPSFTATVSKNVVGLNESFTLTFKLNASGEKFKPPVLSENFKIYSGPNQSTSMSYVNGRMSSSLAYQYLLVPINEGTFIIEPATIEVDGESFSSNPIEIQVVKQSPKPKKNSGTQQSNQNKQQPPSQAISENLYLKLTVDKKSAVVGEQVVASYKLYNRLDLVNIEGQKLPDFVGFYTDDVELDPGNNVSREVINGVIYQVYLLKKTSLFPQRTGDLELRPLELTATIREREATPVNTFFGPRYQYKQKQVALKSNALTIKVSEPSGSKPASFSGAVGAFQLKSSIDNNSVNLNGAINLKYTISGSGNLKLVDLPKIDFPVDFEVYDPKISTNINNPNGDVSGTKTFEYLIIPRVPGSFDIPDVKLSYFNPNTGNFESTKATGYSIEVIDDGSSTSQEARVRQKKDLQQIGNDIRFIKTESEELSEKGSEFYGSVWFFLAFLLPTFLALGVYIALRRYEHLQADQIGLRKKRAGKIATKQLKHAESLLQEGNKSAFYEELSRALIAYVSGKLALPMSEMNKERISQELAGKKVENTVIQELLSLLEECEMARYAPGGVSGTDEAFSKAERVIENLEKSML